MVNAFLSFIEQSPSAFHAVQSLCAVLDENGFEALNEQADWQLTPGKGYYVTRNRSAVIAFRLPESGVGHFQIVASHSDSPCFKLKPLCEDVVCGKYVRLNTERYGGMIMSSWFDRPLSIAGRVLVKENGGLSTRLADLGRDAAIIPNMPIHFNREVNDGYKFNAQTDLLPLYCEGAEKGKLMEDIAESCGVKAEDIVAGDLFLYSRTPGMQWDQYFACPRIDDLECAWTSMQAFAKAPACGHVNVCAVFDTSPGFLAEISPVVLSTTILSAK